LENPLPLGMGSCQTRSGQISQAEAKELVEEAEKFSKVVLKWLKTNHPNLVKG